MTSRSLFIAAIVLTVAVAAFVDRYVPQPYRPAYAPVLLVVGIVVGWLIRDFFFPKDDDE